MCGKAARAQGSWINRSMDGQTEGLESKSSAKAVLFLQYVQVITSEDEVKLKIIYINRLMSCDALQ